MVDYIRKVAIARGVSEVVLLGNSIGRWWHQCLYNDDCRGFIPRLFVIHSLIDSLLLDHYLSLTYWASSYCPFSSFTIPGGFTVASAAAALSVPDDVQGLVPGSGSSPGLGSGGSGSVVCKGLVLMNSAGKIIPNVGLTDTPFQNLFSAYSGPKGTTIHPLNRLRSNVFFCCVLVITDILIKSFRLVVSQHTFLLGVLWTVIYHLLYSLINKTHIPLLSLSIIPSQTRLGLTSFWSFCHHRNATTNRAYLYVAVSHQPITRGTRAS